MPTVTELLHKASSRNPGLLLAAAGPSIEAALQEALIAERETAAQKLELSTSELLLLAGEMSAQELRTVKAVLKNRAAVIRDGSRK